MAYASMCENIYTNACVHGTRPPCSCACPMNLDLRDFMIKVSRRSFDSAYRILANDLLFPEIVTRLCGGMCAPSCAENMDILGVERACIQYAKMKAPPKYSVSKKEKRVAVVGAGLAGLACTLRLAVRGFPVTVFDTRDEIGGTLSQVLDRDIYMEEFALQFKHAPYEFRGGRTIESLDELDGFDAVFIATGKDGNDFGLLEGWDNQSMATTKDACWLGGECTGVNRLEGLAQGRVASTSMEKYLLMTGSMSGVPTSFIQKECLFEVKKSDALPVPHEGEFDRAGAKAEAARCRQCDCTACYDGCALMQSIKMYPKDMESIAQLIKIRDTAVEGKEGSRMAFSCSTCGHCGAVCPKGISLEELFVDAKKTLEKLGAFPAPLHSYYLDDMADANGANYLVQLPEGQTQTQYLFFPGCQAAESGPEHVKAAYSYLMNRFPATALILGCCGVPALWAGREELFQETLTRLRKDWETLGKPTMVLMCSSCMKTFRKYLPEIPCVSLYELLDQGTLPKTARRREGVAAVFDPCSSREFPQMQEAVRSLAQKLGITLEELKYNRDQARCCGQGGHIYPSNRKVAVATTAASARQSEAPYITYCENCRNVFLLEGKENRHILDDVFGIEPLTNAPHIEQLQPNRTALRHTLAGTEPAFAAEETICLCISDALHDKMDRALISAKDVRETIAVCERTGRRIWDEEQKTYIGYLKVGYITYWVQYKKLQDGSFELVNVYCHKLEIGDAT